MQKILNQLNLNMNKEPQRFSEYFNLKYKQEELEFLDIYAEQEIKKFIDPYAIIALNTNWSIKCEKHIKGFFQFFLDSLKDNKIENIKKCLNAFHEVDEIALGYSSKKPTGRGIGPIQSNIIQNKLKNSEAFKTGDIRDIADFALMIHGINRDKISDITASILKIPLCKFTLEQAKKYNIPVKKVIFKNTFDYETISFIDYRTELPIINGKHKILLPLLIVKRNPLLSKDKYYRNYILENLKVKNNHPGNALVTILKNGKQIVRKKDLMKKYPLSTKFIYEFSKENPDVLEKYKKELRKKQNENDSVN